MGLDQREIVTRLFATATSFAEAAHEASCDGQAHDASVAHYQAALHRILSAAHDLQVLGEVIGDLVEHTSDEAAEQP